jgi:hypothetical protein
MGEICNELEFFKFKYWINLEFRTL